MEDQTTTTAAGSKRPVAAFREAVDNTFHMKQLGETGMPEYTNLGVGSNVLALSQLVRGGTPTSLVDEILAKGNSNEVADLIVLLFVNRNCRGGKGEKKLAYDIFLRVWNRYTETSKELLSLFPHYGYWKDHLHLMVAAKEDPTFIQAEDLIEASIALMREQFLKDLASVEQYKNSLKEAVDEATIEQLKRSGPEISLLAKWLPREGTSFDKKVHFVKRFTHTMKEKDDVMKEKGDEWKSATKANYRRQVAQLTSYLDLPEVLLAAKREEEIRFGKLAGRATMLLRKVFLNEKKDGSVRSNDPKRVRLAEIFMKHVVEKGLKGAQLMPHEIVEKILGNSSISRAEEMVFDAQWKDIWRNVVEQVKAKAAEEDVEFSPTQMVPLCDVSGSMFGVPMNVAIALSIGISEITHEAFKDMILTFEAQPRWHRLLPTDSIVKKVRSLALAPWGMNTNFEAAYDLVLKVVEDSKLNKSDMPSMIVFSDMQFDEAVGYIHGKSAMETVHDLIRTKVQAMATRLGWEATDPTPIVYWNLRNTGGHPVDKDTEGAVLLSGFSPSLLKMVMYGDALREDEIEMVQTDGSVVTMKVRVTPEDVLRKMLDDKLYDPVRALLIVSREESLLEYEIPLTGELTACDDGKVDDDFDLV